MLISLILQEIFSNRAKIRPLEINGLQRNIQPPSELSIMITLSNDNPGWHAKALLAVASLLATFLIGLTLWMAAAIERFLGRTGINVMTRVMALIVARSA
ncbi:MarC family protein [Bradyrhizobium zhanjiangense]|uniref:MarC family protein n=1 Tax=Bradyrhizobium zhanjiangense TaxID=1325107 RepID=UPI0023EBDB62|nr:MarC family protein [Bradyrhizobium zhanjiangense]